MICKAIYNTRYDAEKGATLARVELAADTAPEAMPTSGAGVDGLSDALLIDEGSRLYVLDSGQVSLYAGGAWHELANAAAAGVLEISAPGTYDVSDKALVVVTGGGGAP